MKIFSYLGLGTGQGPSKPQAQARPRTAAAQPARVNAARRESRQSDPIEPRIASKQEEEKVTPIRPGIEIKSQVRSISEGQREPTETVRRLKSYSDLPGYVEVSSTIKGGKFELNPKQQESMVVLKLSDEADLYAVIAVQEQYASAAFIGVVERIQASGGKVSLKAIGDGALITRLSIESKSSSSGGERENAQIVREIHKLTQAAIDAGASDIHIEKRLRAAKVQFRINGELEVYSDSWTPEYVMTMARTLHTIADEDSKDTSFSETGSMAVGLTLQPSGVSVKLRVQMSPAYPDSGLDIVMRVLRVGEAAKVKTLEELGYAPDHVEMLNYMQSSPSGIVLVSGTTGSGKSTTLQTLMHGIHEKGGGRKKLISIEDPPEYVMAGVTQIPVARRKKQSPGENPFAQAMRATMRMDPDVIMVGEIRDEESATLMVGMTQSGHKVLSTLHTDSALGAVDRLHFSMGVGLDVLGSRSFISGLIYQVLVPALCHECKVDYDPASEEIDPALHERIKHVTLDSDTIFLRAKYGTQCRACGGKGITGRTVCAEMIVPDKRLLELIREGDTPGAYEYWRSQRQKDKEDSFIGATALDHAIWKMRKGLVSPVDVEASLGLLHDFTKEATSAAEAAVSDLIGLE